MPAFGFQETSHSTIYMFAKVFDPDQAAALELIGGMENDIQTAIDAISPS